MTNLMGLITKMQKENEAKAYAEAKAAAEQYFEEVICKEIEDAARCDFHCRAYYFDREDVKFFDFIKQFLTEQGFKLEITRDTVKVAW